MKKTIYLCPNCKKISIEYDDGELSDWAEVYSERIIYNIVSGEPNEAIEILDSELEYAKHDCGFTTEMYCVVDFSIEIDLDKKEITSVGSYWEGHKDKINIEEILLNIL